MTTFAELTDDVLLYLSGFAAQDQATYLSGSMTAADLTIPLADATAFSRGLVEIEDELLWVDDVNPTGLTAVVPPYGRGFLSTTAAVHAAGVRVVSAPSFPRSKVKKALNDTINSLYPVLWGVATTSFTYVAGQYTYPLAAGTQAILQVQWQDSTTATTWHNVRRYDADIAADATVFPTGSSITVNDNIIPGRTVRVVYTKQPTPLSANGDVFTTVTGLSASCEDLVRLGAQSRLISNLEVPHIGGTTAEADYSQQQRPTGSGVTQAKWLLQQYQIRLSAEADKLNQMYPVRVRYTF